MTDTRTETGTGTGPQSRPTLVAAPLGGVATRLEAALRPFVGGDLPVRLRAWDGSEAGPSDAPLVELRSQDAVRRLLLHPGELGAAQAYVTGEIEVHHDLDDALTHVWSVARERGLSGVRPTPGAFVRALRTAVDVGALGRPPKTPVSQAKVKGRLHSKLRDRRAISHHYDLSNEFYSLILEPQMAYSSGYFTSDDPAYTVEDAQRDKLDLVCTKLGLKPGMRFLDIGCGWGSLSLHAAEHFGAQVTGVTIAAEQKKFIDERIRERGLDDQVDIRLQDYREIPEVAAGYPFDAVGSLEMGEHVGEQNYSTYAQVLHDAVKPGGRVLIQQMSRAGGRKGHPGGGPFIESFIAPDMHMRPVGETVAFLERGGLEVRDVHMLREHYVRTVDGWLENFESNIERLTELVGEEVVRVWRLYLVGGSMAFRDGRMGVDQILMVRPGAAHTLPAVRNS
jgi:cyclopropane-fatty-acyl-phospholipid synthase